MKHFICTDGKNIELSEDQVKRILESIGYGEKVKLAEVSVGEIVRVGGYEFLVLEQLADSTAIICKDLIGDDSAFSDTDNNYDGSFVDEICNSLSGAIADAVGEDSILTHTVDLTSDDGLKDYGSVERRVSLLTAEQYRRYVEILDNFKPDRWWWLATPYSTKRHGNDRWAKCVSPSGYFNYGDCDIDYGVRPFCILKSDIFVSK